MCMKRTRTAPAAAWLVLGLLHAAIAGGSLLEEAERHHCRGHCPHHGGAAALDVVLLGAGSHRQLVYRLELGCPQHINSDGADGTGPAAAAVQRWCGEAAVLQPLPAAVFADIYELDNAAAVGQGPPVLLFGPVDVESIERRSQPTLLAVYTGNSSTAAAVVVRDGKQVRYAPACKVEKQMGCVNAKCDMNTLLLVGRGFGQRSFPDMSRHLRLCRVASAVW
jgi:hypothetical protein